MSALGARIARLIAAQGPISIAEYMTLALHDPRDGYYATRDPLGEGGDFITAPEVSQMFGELLGLWLAQAWHDQGKPARPRLIELGPGRGTLMRDALRATKLMPDFREQLEVVLVELSPVLRRAQEAMLQDCGVPVRWVESFGAVAADRPGFVIANEFFDALPIRQYVRQGRGWFERMVTADARSALSFALAPVPLPAMAVPASREDAPEGGVYEVCAAGEALAEQIAQAIAARGGAALIVDYGYDAPGFGETLQAMRRHAFADVLGEPGENDLTAHVDFTALGDAAVRGGASVCGPVEQGDLLLDLGIYPRSDALAARNPDMRDTLTAQIVRLCNPAQMGTLFKALAIVPKTAPTPPGF
jgi:NADH dehydrogenase [ubiquinone] 1 alpha subcomplex assembly factor 7